MVLAPSVGDVGGKEKGYPAAADGNGRQERERLTSRDNRLVHPEREEHDAGDERELQIAVGVPGQTCALDPLGLLHTSYGSGRETEVRPPHGG